MTDKVYFLCACFSDGHLIAAPQQFQIDNVLQNEIDIAKISAKDSLTNSVIDNIIFLIGT